MRVMLLEDYYLGLCICFKDKRSINISYIQIRGENWKGYLKFDLGYSLEELREKGDRLKNDNSRFGGVKNYYIIEGEGEEDIEREIGEILLMREII